jgi:hypothetical protein
VTPRTLVWTGAGGTDFATAPHWNDTTSGLDPAALAPNGADTARFIGVSGAITGTGGVAVMTFDANGSWLVTSGASLTASKGFTVGGTQAASLLINSGASITVDGASGAVIGGADVPYADANSPMWSLHDSSRT